MASGFVEVSEVLGDIDIDIDIAIDVAGDIDIDIDIGPARPETAAPHVGTAARLVLASSANCWVSPASPRACSDDGARRPLWLRSLHGPHRDRAQNEP